MKIDVGSSCEGRDDLIEPIHPAGLLLTGGASRRMGRDKARLELGGVPLAVRAARALRDVAYPVLAVGGAAGTDLTSIEDPREGPLVAFAHGARSLATHGPVLLVACDLPFVTAAFLRKLLPWLGAHDAVIPVLAGHDQPVCACYSAHAAEQAASLVDSGNRAMRDLVAQLDVVRFDANDEATALMDLDTPQDYDEAMRILDGPE